MYINGIISSFIYVETVSQLKYCMFWIAHLRKIISTSGNTSIIKSEYFLCIWVGKQFVLFVKWIQSHERLIAFDDPNSHFLHLIFTAQTMFNSYSSLYAWRMIVAMCSRMFIMLLNESICHDKHSLMLLFCGCKSNNLQTLLLNIQLPILRLVCVPIRGVRTASTSILVISVNTILFYCGDLLKYVRCLASEVLECGDGCRCLPTLFS